jgi:obg-like ATPase 1
MLRPYTQMIQQGYKELNLIYYFTAGEKEVRCWTLQSGSLVGPTARPEQEPVK